MTTRELRSLLFDIEEQDKEITLEEVKKIMKEFEKAKTFKLFGGCLGNGTTVCNKAVMENGDYKTIAHISNGGRIKWYIQNPESYVPEKDMNIIKGWADTAHEKFLEEWNKLPDIRKYEKILDAIPYSVLLEHPLKETLKACTDLHKKVELLEKIYFEKYI